MNSVAFHDLSSLKNFILINVIFLKMCFKNIFIVNLDLLPYVAYINQYKLLMKFEIFLIMGEHVNRVKIIN